MNFTHFLRCTYCLLFSFYFVPAQAQLSKQSLEKRIDSLIAETVNSSSPGSAILVVQKGEILFNKGYGLANLEHQIPIGPNTVFDLASVSKQFGAFAIATLVEEGKISLQDDIRKYIPELPNFGTTITIDHLVHHTSGIRDWTSALPLGGWRFHDVISFDQILRMAYNQNKLNFEPGSEYSYSNTGYNLLAELVQRVSGQSFVEWTNEHIFQPLGMANTQFVDDHTTVIPNRAGGYYKGDNDVFHRQPNNLMALGSSSMFSTTTDLAKWVSCLDQPPAKLKPIISRMFQKGKLNNGEENSYAFGLSVDEFRKVPLISHSGSWASFRTYLAYFPDQRLSVVVLNNYPSNTYRTAMNIASWFLPPSSTSEVDTDESEKEQAVTVPTKILDEYVGTYRLGPAWYVTLSRKGNELWTQATDEDIFPMTGINESLFRIEAYGGRTMAFHRDASGKVKHFVYAGMECPKLEDYPIPDAEVLKEYVGEYKSKELATSYNVVVEGGQLKMKHFRHGSLDLKYAWKDDFRGSRYFIYAIEFQRNKANEITGLKVSQNRARNQWFEKVK